MTNEALIRAARSISNAAIVRKDVETIASFWTDEIHVLGSMSRQLSGVQANRQFYETQFASRPDTSYARTPVTVQVMATWKVALETGEWVATWTDADGPVRVGGSYMAQWLQSTTGWRIQGEIYVPTSCIGGAYCEQHPLKD